MQKEYLRLPLVEIFDEDQQVNATSNDKTDAERMKEAGWIERLSDVWDPRTDVDETAEARNEVQMDECNSSA